MIGISYIEFLPNEHNMAFAILPYTSLQIPSCIYGISNNFIKKCIKNKKRYNVKKQ